MKYPELTGKPDLPGIQADVLNFWKENQIFEKSVKEKTKGEVVFYDGPPFPTGSPHHGTVLVSFIKDLIARYKTMKGFSVPRVWGWDCHGLPIEKQAESALGIEGKKDIDKDIGRFNEACFDIVSGSNEAWREYVEQMARWVDYDGAYKTMNIGFMESVMWAFKECYDKGLIYRDYRVTPYCMKCETSLSISDTRESDSTRPRQDRWVVVRFKIDEPLPQNSSLSALFADIKTPEKPVYILAWTTTPWTLPSNMCLAVGADVSYAFVDMGEQIYIASKATLSAYEKVFGAQPDIIAERPGKDLAGCSYTPLFPYFENRKADGAFKVVTVDYVDAGDGTGVVHTAPAFGEDDYWTCKKYNMPFVNPVDTRGRFTAEVSDFHDPKADKNVIETNSDIIRYLYEKKSAVTDGTTEHNYPHCWRCREPLIYRAMDAWYFSIEKIKDDLIAVNEEINWVPETVKYGRFGNWLAGARDWNISRNRYWSTPIPIWECNKCSERVVLGSIDEIFKASDIRLENLHRQYMDKVTFACKCCEDGVMRRIPEVLDCWFESGSVSFAQKHYPFENKKWFESHFPSDFIVEYTGQIRCWFYYMHVMSVALFNKPAFKNCIVHGTILAGDGKKLSKSSKNYTDPMALMKKYGTDAFRMYLFKSNAMLIGDLLFNEDGIPEMLQQVILPLWNACNFFISYANIDGYFETEPGEPDSTNGLDRWILAELYGKVKVIEEAMDTYRIDLYALPVISLIGSLTNWYIRRSRRRFWGTQMTQDKKSAYDTLFFVLTNTLKLLAPVAPIISETLFKTLTGKTSVHLESWPALSARYQDDVLTRQIEIVRSVINLARSIRNKNKIKNRHPLSKMSVAFTNKEWNALIDGFGETIAEEMNVKRVEVLENVEDIADLRLDPNFNEIRSRYPDRLPEIIKAIKSGMFELLENEAILTIDGAKESFSPEIILVSYKANDTLSIAGNADMVVSLDLTITDELRSEGLARDIIRNIQEARKQIGCDIMDRIKIRLGGNYPAQWAEHIMAETLGTIEERVNASVSVEISDDTGGVITIEIEK
ncbi:MAG: isoleucine--tRNA ligase [Oscillospiraceae bacterium]|nr:isoleucine--tRNA ligase [Oscillospiraceae bacterium]